MKDYYAILGCTPLSSPAEIKRLYRKLAHQYHPDKNQVDKYAEARFYDIKEAYETLTHPAKKEAWLQERWLRQVYHRPYSDTEPRTPYSILHKVLKLDKHVSSQDIFRLDQYAIAKSALEILSEENIDCLHNFKETEVNKSIVLYLLSAIRPLALNHLSPIWPKLERIASHDSSLLAVIRDFYRNKKLLAQKERWTLPVVFVITILICLLIFFASK